MITRRALAEIAAGSIGLAAALSLLTLFGVTDYESRRQSKADLREQIYHEAVGAGAAQWVDNHDGTWGIKWINCKEREQ